MLVRRAGAVAAGGGLVTGLSVLDWPALVALLAVGAMAIATTCWIVNDQQRPKRLALLIRTWRGYPPGPVAARRSLPGPRAGAPVRKAARTPGVDDVPVAAGRPGRGGGSARASASGGV